MEKSEGIGPFDCKGLYRDISYCPKATEVTSSNTTPHKHFLSLLICLIVK